jgi:hypothetical protein
MSIEVIIWKTAAFFGSARGAAILGKIRSLDGTGDKEILNREYSILTILDAKANGLLRVNSLFLTILIFFIGWSHANGFPASLRALVPIAYVDTVMLALSSILCLLIVAVSWKFLGHVTTKDGRHNFEGEIKRLANVVDDRTHYYWLAWWGTLLSPFLSLVWWLLQ